MLRNPAGTEVEVIGVPDERWGEVPKAFVVLAAGQLVEEGELIAHVKSKLDGYKAPTSVVFVDELPKTATGKIRKHELREAEWAGKGSRIQG